MKLYYNPISSYSQKALVAFQEKKVSFTPEIVDFGNADARKAYEKVNPLGKVPLLVLDDGHVIPESSIIIEYLDTHFDTGTRLVPADQDLARQTRFYDRVFDLYVNGPFQKIFFDGRKPEAERDPAGVAQARATLEKSYALCDKHFAKHTWANGVDFSMADCAAAPSLGYARMVLPFGGHKHLEAYWNRLAERPSFAKVQADAAPFLAKVLGK